MDVKKKITGVVVSAKSPKTIVVESESHRKHPKYKKRVQFRAKYYAHDEKGLAKEGDIVTIVACRPLSALKRFVLVSVDSKAVESIKIAESEELKEVLHEEDTKEAE